MKKLLFTMMLVTSAASNSQTLDLRLGHEFPITHPISQGLELAAKTIKEESNGRITVRLFPASQLGTGREIMQQVSSGTIDMAFTGAAMLGNWHKPMAVFEAPFLAESWDQFKLMLDSPVAKKLFVELETKANISKVGDSCYTGQRHFTTRNKPIVKPEDLKGMKIRVPEVPTFIEMIRALGAQPTPMPLGEVYLSLQTGAIDGQENPLPTINGAKLQEVQKFVSLTGHITSGLWPVANTKTWAKLDNKDRNIIINGLIKGSEFCTKMVMDQENSLIKEFESKGVKFTQPDRAAFAKAMQSVYTKNEENWGKGLVEQLKQVK